MTSKDSTNKNSAATKAAKFAKLRQRAIDSGVARGKSLVASTEDYVLGEDYGFSPEIRIKCPSLESALALQQNFQNGDVWGVAQSLIGPAEAVRVVRALDEGGDTNAAEEAFLGLILEVMEHFYGPGSFNVAGGFTA